MKQAINWDFKLKEKIEFFDPKLTYELTKYRPVDEELGLDFDPNWFREAAINKATTGRYTNYPSGTLAHRRHWEEEMRRCMEGMEVNGYRVTGDHYFFLNYYILLNVSKVEVAGAGRQETQPDFWSKHYEYFHYIEMCERLGRDVIAFKSRGVGFSEIAVSLGVRPYTTTKNYSAIYIAYALNLLEPTIAKAWSQLEYLNQETEGGFRRLRSNIDQALHKQASIKDASGAVRGHMAEIKGIVVDNSRKLRGRRIDRLIYEESGSNEILIETYIKGEALVELNGIKMGTRVVFGTGGDSGPALAGLDKMFNNVEAFNGLPYRHSYTRDGKEAYTAYFLPAFSCVPKFKDKDTGEFINVMDNRGVTNTMLAKQYYNSKRSKLAHLPQELLDYCAEYCFYPEEALIKQGQNDFNQVLLAEQYAEIEIHKTVPAPERGDFLWVYNNENQIVGVKWKPSKTGSVYIAEHPVKDETGNPMKNLYVSGTDAIDHGIDDSVVKERGSKFAIVVKKRTFGNSGDRYVCRYMERPHDVRKAFNTAAQILWYYGCKTNLEDTKISFRTWLREKKWDHKMLMTRPSYAMDDRKRGVRGQTLWGTPGSEKMIRHGLELVAQYIEDFSRNLTDIEQVKEYQKFDYDLKGAFDLTMASVHCEIADEDMYKLKVIKEPINYAAHQDVGYFTDEYGIKRFGVIPKSNPYEYTNENYYEESASRRKGLLF